MSEILPICQVCNKNESVGVACSVFGAVSLAYCGECLAANRDSYGLLVATAACIPVDSDRLEITDFREDLFDIIEATLEFHGKTMRDLRRDSSDWLEALTEFHGEVEE